MTRARITPDQIAALKARVPLASLIGESVVLQRDTRTEFIALCPFHAEDTPSFRVYPNGAYCFGCGWHGDAIGWLMEHERMSFLGAVRHLREWTASAEPKTTDIETLHRPDNYGWSPVVPTPHDAPPLIDSRGIVRAFNPKRQGTSWEWTRWRPSLVHPYRSAGGELVGYVLRVAKRAGGKFTPTLTFCQNAAGERRWCVMPMPSPRPLYRLDELVKCPTATVLVVEGEKAADAGQRLLPMFVVTTWAGGSKAYHHADWSPLKGRSVVCIPDNDAPGRDAFDGRVTSRGKQVPGILEVLARIGADARCVEPPAGLADGWDLADAEKEGWDTARTLAWIKQNITEPRRAA